MVLADEPPNMPEPPDMKHSLLVLVYPLEHVEHSPRESQSAHPVLLPLVPQQLPPRHTPLEQELLEEHVPPSLVLLLLPFLYTQLPELEVA